MTKKVNTRVTTDADKLTSAVLCAVLENSPFCVDSEATDADLERATHSAQDRVELVLRRAGKL